MARCPLAQGVTHSYWQLLLLVLPLEQFLLHRENLCLANTLSDALKIWACFSNRVWSERGQNLCAFFLGGGGTEQHIVVSIPKLYRKSHSTRQAFKFTAAAL